MADDPARPAAELVTELADEAVRLQSLPGEQWPGRAAVGLAYRRLDDSSARLFHLLAAAPVPHVTAEAAAALVNQPVAEIRPALAALARIHLLESRQPGRWRIHDQIRRYATEVAADELGHSVIDINPEYAVARDTTVPPRSPSAATVQRSTQPRATSPGRASSTDRRRPRRWLLLNASVIAVAALAFTFLKQRSSPIRAPARPGWFYRPPRSRLVIPTSLLLRGSLPRRPCDFPGPARPTA